MIDLTKVKNITQLLAQALSVPVIRANQTMKQPNYPFGMWQVLIVNNDAPYMDTVIKTVKPVPEIEEPETEVDSGIIVTRYTNARATLSLTFLGNSEHYYQLHELAKSARDWFNSTVGSDALSAEGFTASPLGDVSDRTSFLEPAWEIRIGFDVRLESKGSQIEELTAIENIEINGNELALTGV